MREGLTVAILKKVRDSEHPSERKHLVMPAFSFATDSTNPISTGLANMIIDAWKNVQFTYTPPGGVQTTVNLFQALMDRNANRLPSQTAIDTATAYVQTKVGLVNLTRAVVISEAEHENDYVMQSDNEIVFVLPDQNRVSMAPAASLVDTAKFLMACTPNGI